MTTGDDCKVVATVSHPNFRDPVVVGVEKGDVIAVCFHPELTQDARIHAHFVEKVLAHAKVPPQREQDARLCELLL